MRAGRSPTRAPRTATETSGPAAGTRRAERLGSRAQMAQKHMERLTPMDVSFLDQEKEGSHMHIGAVMIFEGPPPPYEDLRAHIESRLHLVPRYRQKLAYPRFQMGRPLWIDDPSFNLEYHVRHTGLASPGGVEQLRLLVGRIFSQRLDRSKPLWELWLVQGLEGNRFA